MKNKNVKKKKLGGDIDKPMLKFQFLATSGLAFIHGVNNMSVLILCFTTVPKIAKIGIVLHLLVSNIIIYFILKKFGRVWFK